MRIAGILSLALIGGLVLGYCRADPEWRPAVAAEARGGRPVALGRPIPLANPQPSDLPPLQPVKHSVAVAYPPADVAVPAAMQADAAVLGPNWDSSAALLDDAVVTSEPYTWCPPEGPCQGGWTAGGGVYWIQPHFEANTAFALHRRIGPDKLADDYRNFRHHMDAAPLVWIGYTWEGGLGIRGRWFQFEQDAYETITKDSSFLKILHARPLDLNIDFGTARGSRFEFWSNLKVSVWDLEVTKAIDYCDWCLLASAGVRYAHVSQAYMAFGPRSETDLRITSGHNFNGAGPTFSFEGKHHLFNTCLSLYGNARASILFGTAKQTAYEVVNDRATGALVHSTLDHVQHTDILPIGELEIGLEYGRFFGKVRAFVQAGFVGQIWWGGGNASNTNATGQAAENTSNFGFVGAVLRLGLTF